MSKLVRGDQLPSSLRRQVLARYVHRWTSDNPQREHAYRGYEGKPTIPLVSDEQWLREHAFYVTDRGTLDARRKHAEPAYMIEDKGTAKTHRATKKSGGLKHWKVKFTRRGMEPPRPFGKTTAVVCAESREAAKEMVPASPNYPITVSATTEPVSFTHHCHHKTEDAPAEIVHEAHATKKKSPAQLEREIAEALSKSGKGHRPSKLGGDYFTVVLTRAKPAATNEWNRLPAGWDSQTRGTFPSKYAAFQWAKEKLLPGAPFTVRYVPLGDA